MHCNKKALALVATLLLGGCATDSDDSPSSTPSFRPTASVQDLMLSIVDPAADTIWEAVATIVTHEGVEERRPSTDEEWEVLRHEAVRLVESTNLLLMHDREIAHPDFQSENPGIELEPEQIQALIDQDPETWDSLVADLYQVSASMLEAVENKDADRIFDEGGPLDVTCERCHQRYWYPDNVIPESISTVGLPTPPSAPPPSGDESGGPTGTIQGRIRLDGPLPGNPIIRMGVDPLCARLTEGKQLVQETVRTSPDGGLANVFVKLDGTFPETPVPDEAVVIDQMDCLFVPRVVGARAGQRVQVKNSDPLLHNLNSLTTTTNSFNVGQPVQGMVYEVRLDEEVGMLRIRCDLHRWMTEYIGVVPHPYFDVSNPTGAFTISNVPVGTHTIQTWHEEYGELSQTVTVEADGVAVSDFVYPATSG